jgi:hypothetical protein
LTNSELQAQIAEKLQNSIIEFDGLKLLSFIGNFMQADDNLTFHRRNLQDHPSRPAKSFHPEDENMNYPMVHRHKESELYPQLEKHLQAKGRYDFTNPEPSEISLSSNQGISSYGKNDIERKVRGLDSNEYSGGNRVAEMYQEDFNKKSSSNNESPVKAQSTDISQRNLMPSSTNSTGVKDQERSFSERARSMACNFDKTKPAEEAMTSGESSYWDQKVKKNRYYVMPIKDTVIIFERVGRFTSFRLI